MHLLLQAQAPHFTSQKQLLADLYHDGQQKALEHLHKQTLGDMQSSLQNDSAQAELLSEPHTMVSNHDDIEFVVANTMLHQQKQKAVAEPGKDA